MVIEFHGIEINAAVERLNNENQRAFKYSHTQGREIQEHYDLFG